MCKNLFCFLLSIPFQMFCSNKTEKKTASWTCILQLQVRNSKMMASRLLVYSVEPSFLRPQMILLVLVTSNFLLSRVVITTLLDYLCSVFISKCSNKGRNRFQPVNRSELAFVFSNYWKLF